MTQVGAQTGTVPSATNTEVGTQTGTAPSATNTAGGSTLSAGSNSPSASPTGSASASKSSPSGAVIGGIVAGVVVGIALIALIGFVCYRQGSRRSQSRVSDPVFPEQQNQRSVDEKVLPTEMATQISMAELRG